MDAPYLMHDGLPVIIDDEAMSEIDLTRCRSPSRALRRFRRGIVGNVRMRPKWHALTDGKVYVMHSRMYLELQRWGVKSAQRAGLVH